MVRVTDQHAGKEPERNGLGYEGKYPRDQRLGCE
jgi:hypothetical protein